MSSAEELNPGIVATAAAVWSVVPWGFAMPVHFRLTSAALSDEGLDRLSRSLITDAREEGIELNPAAETFGNLEGRRGDPVTLGVLALAVVTSGSVVALFNLLKSYVDRSEELNLEFAGKDGSPVKLSMKNVSLDKFKEVMQQLKNDDE